MSKMKFQLSLLLVLCSSSLLWAQEISQSSTSSIWPQLVAQAYSPGERDRQVLNTVLLHVLTDSESNMTRFSGANATVILHVQTPDKTGMIRPEQIAADVGKGHSVSADILSDLLHRNEKPGSYDSWLVSFAGLKFDKRIVLADLIALGKNDRTGLAFEHAYPTARAWIEAWLPGYSKDGTQAVARGWIGPSDHGAVFTAFLEKSGDKWLIKWHHLSRFL